MPSNSRFQIEVLDSEERFIEIKELWTNFETRIGNTNLTASYLWLRTWWETFSGRHDSNFGSGMRLLILLVKRNDYLIGIAPFVRVNRKRKIQTLSSLEFLGQQWAATLLDILADNNFIDEINKFLLDWLKTNIPHHILNLGYIPDSSPLLRALPGKSHPLSACPTITLRNFACFEDYQMKSFSKSLKQNLRTAINKMRSEGREWQCSIERVNSENFMDIERLSNSKLQDGKHSLYQDADKARFIRNISSNMDASVLFIILDGKKVAYRLNIIYRNQKFCLDASYDRLFPKFELGGLSVQESIRESFAKNLTLHCEGTGVDFYKLKFTKDTIRINTIVEKGNLWTSGFYTRRQTALAVKLGKIFSANLKNLYT